MLTKTNTAAGVAAAALALATLGAAAPALAQSDPLIPGVTGCGASGNKQAGGAVLGALAGGLLGNSVSGHNRTTGTLLGAAVGGAAGSAVGCQMQHNEQDRTAQAQPSYAPQADRQEAPQEAAQTYSRDGYELSNKITPASYEDIDDDALVATRVLTMRAAPANDGVRVGKLRRGERFDVLAKVRGGDWVLVGRDGVGVGYVQKAYTRPDSQRLAGR
jgi:hypothetical protein